MAFDSAGTAYVADQWNNTIRKVTASGTVTTLAGTTTPGYRDGSGEVALFDNPVGIAVDGAGIVYVADQGNQRIRKIDPAGNVTTYAGSGTAGFADGAAATAEFYNPTQLAVDGSGNLYVADRSNHRIRRISPSGTVTTVAGSGDAGYADGSGAAAQFNQPTGVASDAAGNLVVVEMGNRRVRRVTSSGVVTTLAGSGLAGSADGTGTGATFWSPFNVALDGSGNTLVVDATTHNIRQVTPAGVVTTLAGGSGASALDGAALVARFRAPRGIAVDSSGTVLVADTGNSLIRRLASGQVSTLAGAFGVGYADGDALVARFNKPVGIVAHASGHYVIDKNNRVIRNVARSGLVTTLAGRPGVSGGADGAATVATFGDPYMGTLDASGNLLVNDLGNQRIRRVTPTGNVTTVGASYNVIVSSLDGSEATARFDNPLGLATAPDGTVYVSERGTSHRLRRLAMGNVTTLAGRLQYLDGTGLNARFNTPYSIAVDLAGNVYLADTGNHLIRKMSPAGDVTTVAGTGVPGFADGPAGTAMFKFPTGIDVDPSGTLYVADSENNRIRVVSTSGVVSTLAGSTVGFLDGAGSTARFYSPWGVAVEGSGSVLVADRSSNRIRRVSPTGVVSTVAGGASWGYVDGPAASARFNEPRGVAVDSAGNIYVADNGNRRIRRISTTGDVTTIAGSNLTSDVNGPADTAGFSGFAGGIRVDAQGVVYVVAGYSLRRIASGTVTSLAGSLSYNGTVDGAGASARFFSLSGLALDASGNFVMTDGGAIRRVSASGQVTTVAGAAAVGSQDGPATDARFFNPAGLACDESGNVYVADQANHRIRKVAPDGTTSTLAGSSSGGLVDGTGSAARFNYPWGVTYDGAGSLYVVDQYNHAIRRVVIASGAVTTVAGTNVASYVDGVGSAARFNGPSGIAMAGTGTLVVTDTGNNRLRTITSAAPGQLGVQWGPSFDAVGAPLQRFVATATATGRPSASCTVTDGSRSCFISGLVSGVSYSVVVAGYDTNGNETPASQATTGAPP